MQILRNVESKFMIVFWFKSFNFFGFIAKEIILKNLHTGVSFEWGWYLISRWWKCNFRDSTFFYENLWFGTNIFNRKFFCRWRTIRPYSVYHALLDLTTSFPPNLHCCSIFIRFYSIFNLQILSYFFEISS